MRLIITSPNDFIIENGKIKTKDGDSFFVEVAKDEIVVSDGIESHTNSNTINNVNGISINGNQISFNGYSIGVNKGKIDIIGAPDTEVSLNNVLLSATSKQKGEQKKALKQNEHYEYKLQDIDNILVHGSGKVDILDASIFENKSLVSLIVNESGHIKFVKLNPLYINTKFQDLFVHIQGSGRIDLGWLDANNLTAFIQGSGVITIYEAVVSSRAFLKVYGNGSISAKGCIAKTIDKEIKESGQIHGFKQ